MDIQNNGFDGVFRFTNITEEDFVFLWNNKEYIFPAGKSTPMIIANESPENVQEIRKKAAYKLAQREFYKGDIYNQMKEQGRGLPPTYDDKLLEPMIKTCLNPLPIGFATVKELPKEDESKYTSKAVSENSNLNNDFKDAPVQALGQVFPTS